VRFVVTVGDRVERVEVAGQDGQYRVTLGDQVWEVDARFGEGAVASLLVGGISYVADITEQDGRYVVDVRGERYEVQVEEEARYLVRTRGGVKASPGARLLTAPLPGRVTHVAVRVGDSVRAGDTLLVIEAMKMENEFRASGPGVVTEVRVTPGQAVNAGDVLVVIDAAGP
jgi:acetyl/propionyl-CoA carboxylase alpha subunit